MSVDTVDGGKVWTPPERESPISPATKILAFLGIVFMTTVATFSMFAFSIKGDDSETEALFLEEIRNSSENDSYGGPSFIAIIALIVAALIIGVIIMWSIEAVSYISMPWRIVGIVVGVMLGVFLIFLVKAETDNAHDKTSLINEWMQENYGYELVEVLPVNNDTEKHAALDVGEEKFVVKDTITGEEKTVHLYERDDNFYLAVDDTEFLEQVKNEPANGNGESK